jgi:hypothetical protein
VGPDTATAAKDLPAIIVAVGALGTAAFGLVDTLKVLPGGGISRAGFKFIRETILTLAPEVPALDRTGLSRTSMLFDLQSQWINGTDTASQVNIAKSLVKLRLTPDTAGALATATAVDGKTLAAIATNILAGAPLTPEQSDVYGRFDVLLTTLLDQAYQRADQRYRNATKFAAVPIAVGLAVAAAYTMPGVFKPGLAVLIGLIATPIAPIAKDLASGIATAVQALQAWKR